MDREAFAGLLGDEGQALLGSLEGYDPDRELAVATRLRRTHAPELVSAALAQARLRQRAAAKFGAEDAARMYFTPNGLEQSTRASVAAYRAERFSAAGVPVLADLCCGIGGDAIALARAGMHVLAVDSDPLTCDVVRANAAALGLADRIEIRCQDVGDADVSGCDAVFVDPARRGGKGRIFDPEAYSPPLSWAVEVARRVSHAALKVAPGIPHEAVPDDAEAEWISDSGDVKEAVLWFGAGRGAGSTAESSPVRATLLPGPRSLLSRGLADPPAGPVGRYLYEPDGAVVRAHLVAEVAAELNGRLIDPTIAYVTCDEPHVTPYATGYEITDVLPFQLKRLRALLRERGIGTATIKKRGSAVEPAELRKKLKLEGPGICTVFLTRVAGAPTVLLGQPLEGPAGA
ncbi:methyltransferase [Streptomyces abyssalis]|uniref:Methyltransferase n=1 Tax=Streptomyces abyssalis TaxID=933944 RepID=A0A1E7JFN3_9ACTN|nr:methyltransferase domain-containing protein [Streptomyces abyssalis]OEU85281.1 methyltransferase [Streptomyces abyssalis]OEU91554.1 methyltransferase [Streptomyces abyssalis]OEV30596.1 methyltransferase [Streptomyces nanshensis]